MNNLYVRWCKENGQEPKDYYAFKCMAGTNNGADMIEPMRGSGARAFIACTVDLLEAGVDIERLNAGRSFGFWNTGIYVVGDSDDTVRTVCGMLRASYSGEGTHIEPIRSIIFPPAMNAASFISDFRHVPLYNKETEEKGIADSVRAGGKRIIHVHVSENDRSTPGEGHVRWDESFQTLAEIGYDGYLMIEAFGCALPEIAGATCIWRNMFPNEEYLARNGLAFMKKNVAKYWKR